MKVVDASELEMRERKNPQRAGRFCEKNLMHGQEGSPDNFLLNLCQTFGDFYSPRHRHNFDQIRIQLVGEVDFDRDGRMGPGAIAYFPEGTFYGPTTQKTPQSLTLVLQFGGAGGDGYMSAAERERAVAQLKEVGEFKDGVFHRTLGEGRKNQDAYEAAWEHHAGRRIRYGESRYQRPVFMNSDAFTWTSSGHTPGVQSRHLATFERGVTIGMLRLEPGAQAVLDGHAIAYVAQGRGHTAQGGFEADDVLYTNREKMSVVGDEVCTLYVIELPQQ